MLTQELIKEYEDSYQDDPWRLTYHLMPPVGWLNDPNGLCQFQGTYHIYYQYNPFDASGKKGQKCWGHYTTKDFLHFSQVEAFALPDNEHDYDGVYSGSAFVEGDTIHYVYTGNRKYEGDYDYIYEGRGHHTMYMSSHDGYHFPEKVCLMENKDYPKDLSCHVRDPKIYQNNKGYYLVLGARTKLDKGCVIVYHSCDLKQWEYCQRIETPYHFGYMWECPDFFELNNQKILITCPQGVEKDGLLYENVYQNGYFVYHGEMMGEYTLSEFTTLDYGFDFYAPQTFEDEKGRRILIGWMGLPDIPYTNPTVEKGWQHALTLPRELKFMNGHLYQYPIEETKQLRKNHCSTQLQAGDIYQCQSHSFELQIDINNRAFHIQLREDVELSYDGKVVTLSLGKSGYGRDQRHVEINDLKTMTFFNDTSSLEIFMNHGEKVMSTRVYDDKVPTLQSDISLQLDYYDLQAYQIKKAS